MTIYDPSSSNDDELIAKKNEARNWPWVVQEWECFKKIKSIHNGPCELIPESFLRDSLSRHHKIDPEKLTGQHWQDVMADLAQCYVSAQVVRSGANQARTPPLGRDVGTAIHSRNSAEGAMPDLPLLSEATKRKLELQWETVRDQQKLTDQELSDYDKERQRLLRIPANPPSHVRPLRPHFTARNVGLTQSVTAAEARFRGLDREYWSNWCSSRFGYEVYRDWLDTITRQVSVELAKIWKGRSDVTDRWFDTTCAPAMEKALAALVKQRIAQARDVETKRLERPTPRAVPGGSEAGISQTVTFNRYPVTVVRDEGTPLERRWEASMGGDFATSAIFDDGAQRVRTGDRICCSNFSEPYVITRIEPEVVGLSVSGGNIAYWKAKIMPLSEWMRHEGDNQLRRFGDFNPSVLGASFPRPEYPKHMHHKTDGPVVAHDANEEASARARLVARREAQS